jgi:hypothetical protein
MEEGGREMDKLILIGLFFNLIACLFYLFSFQKQTLPAWDYRNTEEDLENKNEKIMNETSTEPARGVFRSINLLKEQYQSPFQKKEEGEKKEIILKEIETEKRWVGDPNFHKEKTINERVDSFLEDEN